MSTTLNSFSTDPSVESAAAGGQVAHADHIAHNERLQEELITLRPGVWTLVGNGLSNQTFIEGPEGLIAIDTGECVEEMAEALRQLRTVTDKPVVAVIYTHFHYVSGTSAILAEDPDRDLVIWGHAKIEDNRARAATEISAAYSRGLVHQFGIVLPPDGPDAVVNVGLGLAFRNPSHAPYTPGFIPPTKTLSEATSTTIAGLPVEMTLAPSDADDSITIWFPTLGVAINNLLWPTLFNVFPIRGEEYRDPRVLLDGLDHLLGLGADYLLGAHGRPFAGADDIRASITLYRDSIQFMWDQTVRGLNRGLTASELTEFVQLPECFAGQSITRQYYGVAEHHVRQIRNGLVGWFDGDESQLFPLPPLERCQRLIEGFGGRSEVQAQAEAALASDDLRWALELATWLVRSELGDDGRADGGSPEERALLATVLRTIARRTTAANIRNWCLTRARELDGLVDLTRFRTHRFSAGEVRTGDADVYVRALRVMLDPAKAGELDEHIAVSITDEEVVVGLHVRHGVAVPTNGDGAAATLELDHATLAALLGAKTTLDDAIDAGTATIVGSGDALRRTLGCFDHHTLQLSDGTAS